MPKKETRTVRVQIDMTIEFDHSFTSMPIGGTKDADAITEAISSEWLSFVPGALGIAPGSTFKFTLGKPRGPLVDVEEHEGVAALAAATGYDKAALCVELCAFGMGRLPKNEDALWIGRKFLAAVNNRVFVVHEDGKETTYTGRDGADLLLSRIPDEETRQSLRRTPAGGEVRTGNMLIQVRAATAGGAS